MVSALRERKAGRRHTQANRIAWAALLAIACSGMVAAAPAPPDRDSERRRSPFEGYRLQLLDEPLEIHHPENARGEQTQMHLDAMSWYMTGRLKELKNDLRGALDAYREAVKLAPESSEIYSALVPLAFTLDQTEEAIKYALKALELDPDNYRLQYEVGLRLLNEQQVDEAVRFLDQALNSPQLDKNSAFYVTLNRDLAIIYRHIRRFDKSADCYAVVFAARKNPAQYELDYQSRSRLANDVKTSFETIGQAFLDADRLDVALEAFEKAAGERQGRPGNLNFNLAQVYHKTKQFDKALEQLQRYFDAQLQSKGRDAYELLEDLLEETGKADELVERLETLAEADARNSTLQFFLAEQYVDRDRLEEAEALYRKVLKDSSDADGYVGLASILRRQKRAEELLEALSSALQISGRNLRRLEREMTLVSEDKALVESLIEVGRKQSAGDEPQLNFAGSYLLAKLAVQVQNTDAALEFFRYAIKAKHNRAEALYEELARYLLVAEAYPQAIEILKEAVDDPTLRNHHPHFLYRLSQAYQLAGEISAALDVIDKALAMSPDSIELAYQQAYVYYSDRQWDEAIKRFEQLISKFQGNTDAQHLEIVRRCQFTLSNVFVQQGRTADGEKILEDILAKDPDDPRVNNDLGYLWADQSKNLERAETMIRKAIAAEPDNPAYLDSMGWVLYRLGQFDEAVTHLEKAVTLPFGSDATIWEHLGDCYVKLEKRDKAVESWRKGLEEEQKSPKPEDDVIKRIEDKIKEHSEN